MDRKQIKLDAKEQFKADKLAKKERKLEIKEMDKTEAKESKKSDKLAEKTAKKERKSSITEMDKADKKEAKYFDKKYKREKTKVKRYTKWGILAVIVVAIYATVAPIVGPILSEIGEIGDYNLTTDTAEAEAARANAKEVAKQVTDEGLVLLENKDNVLPLTDDKTLNVFGFGAMNYKMGGGGSGATNLDEAVSLYEGLDQAGIAYNKELYDFYVENEDLVDTGSSNIWAQMAAGILGSETQAEPETADYITDEVMAQAKEYSDTAMIVVTSMSSEASDATVDQLQISDNERALIDRVANEFENVIILVNSGYAMDLTFVDEYESIKSVLWIGNPGAYGAISIGNTLAGNVNPSGRLNDTYVTDISSIPAVQNTGNYQYENIAGTARLDYEEGIYVGYRYYETLFEGNEEAYQAAVQYPFGYGISYTEFDQEIENSTITDKTVTIDVKVTNTGDVAGKEVVQVYFNPPYTEGGIEKSSTVLAGFAKTSELAPGASEIVTIEFDVKDMSSWDLENGNYILEAGDYEIRVAQNAHDTFDSVTTTIEEDVVYIEDEDTNTTYQNLFEYADGDLTYLSRSDFEETFPSDSDVNLTADATTVENYGNNWSEIEGTEATTGAENGIMLADLEGLDFDDAMWSDFLDQFTIEEMISLISYGGYHTQAIERLGVPRTELLDGPAGWNSMFGSKIDAASYPTELLLASTWNLDLAYAIGDAVGQEADAYGIDMWYAPAMNIHRSPIGGRNYEYFSEDPTISGLMAAAMINGAQEDHDLMVTIKHFALNEQEVNARSGVMVWANEQALRELYLRPFEIAVKESDPTGAMSSFINIGTEWAGANDELLNKLLRDEWGFDGIVTTDAQLGSWMNPVDAVIVGNELMLSIFKGASNVDLLTEAYEEMPVLMSNSLRDRMHTIMYNIVNETNAIERTEEESGN